ncbi:MAG: hypothetical protein WC781_03485 [Candidatus Pacearchaeota archaeon]|jgi:hypothetical protein
MMSYIDELGIKYHHSICIDGDGNITPEETFELARNIIENKLELKLPLSALVLLKNYSRETTEEWKSMKNKHSFNAPYPPTEAYARLFYDIFELDYKTFHDERCMNTEEFKEFLKIRLDEIYLL